MAYITERGIHLIGEKSVCITVHADTEETVQISAVPEDSYGQQRFAEFVLEKVVRAGDTDVIMDLPRVDGFDDTKWRLGIHDTSEVVLANEQDWGIPITLQRHVIRD